MAMQSDLDNELLAFEKSFDTSHEDKAVSTRGQFLHDFPLKRLNDLTLDDYVIGKGTASFCAHVEAKTREWAVIQGSTAIKFGIYYGKTKSDPTMTYRFSKKFGDSRKEAFKLVKEALLTLVKSGKAKDFEAIDNNSLSQLFKAKILSLYFPETYLNVCSAEHLESIASELGISKKEFSSEYQHLIYLKKLENPITKIWSNPKYMVYLYKKFIKGNLNQPDPEVIKKPRKKVNRRVDFDEISENRDEIGKKSEKFAMEWEKSRLIGLGYPELAKLIADRRDMPSYGYDFMSHSAHGIERYVEVKSAGRDKKNGGFRFFLSDNEFSVSKSDEHSDEYYFYLVFYGNDGNPIEVLAKKANEIYASCEFTPCAYMVRFEHEA